MEKEESEEPEKEPSTCSMKAGLVVFLVWFCFVW